MAKLDELLSKVKETNGSDLHISSGCPPYIRIHGDMHPIKYRNLTAAECQGLLFELLTEKQKKRFTEDLQLDCAYSVPGVGRFRLNVFMQLRGIAGVFRYIPDQVVPHSKLGLPKSVVDLTNNHNGLVLVTGYTGSGKSTTISSLIDLINKSYNLHIITAEDPIEFVHSNKQSLISQREIGSHTKSFTDALRVALREDPDVILVGEMRDLETIQLALTAAETGHLVFGTLHTNSAVQTINRIVDVFPGEKQEQIRAMLSESLKGVIAQTLVKRADKKGRVAIFEVLIVTPAVANLIRERKTSQLPSVMQTSKAQGMVTFEQSIHDLESRGIILPGAV